MDNKVFSYLAAGTVALLSIPLIITQFTEEMNWGLEDFIVMGILVFGASSVFVLIARVTPRKYLSLIGLGILMTVLWLWIELSVGLFTNWGS